MGACVCIMCAPCGSVCVSGRAQACMLECVNVYILTRTYCTYILNFCSFDDSFDDRLD